MYNLIKYIKSVRWHIDLLIIAFCVHRENIKQKQKTYGIWSPWIVFDLTTIQVSGGWDEEHNRLSTICDNPIWGTLKHDSTVRTILLRTNNLQNELFWLPDRALRRKVASLVTKYVRAPTYSGLLWSEKTEWSETSQIPGGLDGVCRSSLEVPTHF